LADVPAGWHAFRTAAADPWVREPSEKDEDDTDPQE
jgi:hypothetical protein